MLPEPRAALEARLIDENGREVTLRDFRGRAVVLVFLRWLG